MYSVFCIKVGDLIAHLSCILSASRRPLRLSTLRFAERRELSLQPVDVLGIRVTLGCVVGVGVWYVLSVGLKEMIVAYECLQEICV